MMANISRLEELQRRIKRDPASVSFGPLAEEYRRQGLFRQAIETCRAGLRRHPNYVSARVTLGRALLENGEYDLAASELENALRVAPENLAAIRALAEIHQRRRDTQSGIERSHGENIEMSPPVAAPPPQLTGVTSASPDMEGLAGLEAFLAAIERARRAAPLESASVGLTGLSAH